jgi:hypothetical protein
MSNIAAKSKGLGDQSGSPDLGPTTNVEIGEPSAAKEDNSDPPNEAPYSVGYGRPPKNTRFEKGQSGNPKGRPKGARNLNSELRKVLTDPVTMQIRGKRRRVAAILVLQQVLLNKALKGDYRASLAVFKIAKEFGVLDPANMEVPTHTNRLSKEVLEMISDETLDDLIRVEQELLAKKEALKRTQ